MKVGLHYPNSPDTVAALRVASAMGAESVKLLYTEGTHHTLQDLLALHAVGITHVLVRLRDSVYHRPDGSTYIPFLTRYAQDLLDDILLWYERGVREFSVDNEPNWLWTTPVLGPSDYVWYMKRVLALVREGLLRHGATGVILVSPPLSWSPALWQHDPEGTPPEERLNPTSWVLNDWTAAYSAINPQAEEAHERFPFWASFDRVGCTVYWQFGQDVRNPSYGASWYEAYLRSGYRRIVVLELGQTANRLYHTDPEGNVVPIFTPQQLYRNRVVQYRDWLYWAGGSGIVEGTYFWIAQGATDEWRGELVTVDLAREIAKGGMDSSRVGPGRYDI